MLSSSLIHIAVLVALNLWIAWRYSRLPLGQDEGLWMLWGFTGARPYRDHVDCKPPGIHLWLWLLSRLTRRNIALTKFLHFVLIGAFVIAAYKLSGSLNAGLLFTALAQSAWLRAYNAWVEPISSGFLLLALLLAPWPATFCLAIAVLFNLKLGPPGLLLMLLRGWWLQLAAASLGCAAILGVWFLVWPNSFRDVWYGSITVAYRMTRWRKQSGQGIFPRWDAYFTTPLLLVVPALASAILAHPDPVLWIVAATYIVLNALGRVWRPYHWIPLAAIAAVAAPPAAILVLLAEWIASGLYLGNVVGRIRPQVARLQEEAKVVGKKLRNMEGSLWVNDECTQIYIYAYKRPAIGLVEQVEIRHVVPERWVETGRSDQRYDLVVLGPGSIRAVPRGYHVVLLHGSFTVLAKLLQ